MKVPKKPNIVFFVKSMRTTPEEVLESQKYAIGNVRFENAMLVTEVSQGVDGVAGTIPPAYAGYKTAQSAVDEYTKALEAARKASGDTVAPTPKTKPEEREDIEAKDEKPASKPTVKPTVKPKSKD